MANLIAGRYQVQAPLGSGVLGLVVRVLDEATGEVKAVKLFNPQKMTDTSRARFEREFQAVSRIHHPNVVRVHEWGVHGDRPYFVMEMVEGEQLDVYARRGRPAGGAPGHDAFVRSIAQVFRQVSEALGAAHAQGIIHRDVKPENVLVADGPPPFAKLLDFGHSKDDVQRMLTTSGSTIGTATYIAPETALGLTAGPASDLYALGCVLHEALVGRPPFVAEGVVAVLMSHVNEPAPDPRTTDARVPAGLAELCLALMRKAPADRPKSAADVATSFAAYA